MIRIGTVYPYRYVHTRESELTLESGIIESCLNRLCRVQCVSYSELHGARRADSNRLARLMLMRTDFRREQVDETRLLSRLAGGTLLDGSLREALSRF